MSIRDDIKKAMETPEDGGDDEAVIETVEGQEQGVEASAEIPDPAEQSSDEQAEQEAKSRDEKGRFAKQGEPEHTEQIDQPSEAVEGDSPKETIRPPSSWSPEAKANFATLPEPVKAAIVKREHEVDQGFRQKGEQLQRYQPLDSVIAPYREKWAVAGVDESTAIRQLLAASDWLDRDPASALAHLARQYGVSPFQPQAGQPSQAQPDPQVQSLQQQIAQTQQQLQETLRQQQEREAAETRAAIEAFKADPKHIYFDNVRPQMAGLLKSGQAKDLQDAYDMAVWANPETRAMLIKEQKAEEAKAAAAKAKAKAQDAKRAGGSVTGAPGQGASMLNGSANASIRDDIRAAFEEVGGRA